MIERKMISQASVISQVEANTPPATMAALVTWETGILKPGKDKNLVCKYREEKSNNVSKRQVQLQLKEKSFNAFETPASEDFHHFILVRNKKTNKVRMCLAEHLYLKPEQELEKDATETNEFNLALERFKDIAAMKRAFGSKRSIKHLELKERMKNCLSHISENITETLSESKLTVDDVKPYYDFDMFKGLLPPCNRNAETVEDVYKLEDLLTEEELAAYSEEAQDVIASSSEELKEKYSSKFLIDYLSTLPKPFTEEQIKILLYVNCLVQFVELPQLSNKKIKEIAKSELIFDKIKQTYVNDGQRKLSRFMKDKVICDIFILLLLACNFKIFFSFLNNCSKIFRNKEKLLKIIGASPFLKNNSNVFMLKLPLPPLPVGRKRL